MSQFWDETHNKSIDDVECPWCGHSNQCSDLYADLRGPEDADFQCYECEKPIRISFHVSISCTASRQHPSKGKEQP